MKFVVQRPFQKAKANKMIVAEHFQPIQFPQRSVILREGDPGDGCYLVDKGGVRIEIRDVETNSDGVITCLGAGEFLGETKPPSA